MIDEIVKIIINYYVHKDIIPKDSSDVLLLIVTRY